MASNHIEISGTLTAAQMEAVSAAMATVAA